MVESLYMSIGAICEEARHLVESGSITRQQPIHCLCKYFPDREWCMVEHELELNQFLLRDRISDLMSKEDWSND
ncbi:hypothetical protein Syn7502_02501 [Synechococcus sp. PCC 7502]|uniref:DUF4327 family protein n=1 Tax=Synechococcus sp. PCC 7502 TaxID=1173263 RepID=UPI00029FE03D|nr:DUF4327 family protein [Synechococcus sp. PCC 7502]AFY74475.1 hypothetical protein Syn7502_02501 [Synechococcus sp. PCC 7502]